MDFGQITLEMRQNIENKMPFGDVVSSKKSSILRKKHSFCAYFAQKCAKYA